MQKNRAVGARGEPRGEEAEDLVAGGFGVGWGGVGGQL